jgi:putative inorganic carbon (HCO3(-)) transporter
MTGMTTMTLVAGAPPRDRLEWTAVAGLLGFVAALQLSIAAAGICLALTLACWAGTLILGQERWDAPRFFWPLVAYAGWTLVSAAFSPDPRTSFIDSKQLVLFLLVPAVYQLARGSRAITVFNVIITVGAASAVLGIVQYGLLNYDHLGQRPQGTLGHYMTYSGLLVLVICAVVARVLFDVRHGAWAAVVLPALAAALALTFTRSAWVGATVAVAVLFVLRDARLLALVPVLAALFILLAPQRITARFYSTFDLHDPTSRDRVAMLREGRSMIEAHPLTGVGPNMVQRLYQQYRDPTAVAKVNPHLHNVPMQIAAERGLPALAIWIWFVATAATDLWRKFRTGRHRFLAVAGLAAIAGMLSAGLFEHNFGDSEFLMLFLVLLTLPFAADRTDLP